MSEVVYNSVKDVDFGTKAFEFIHQFTKTSNQFLRFMYPDKTNDSSKLFDFDATNFKITHLISLANSLIQDLHVDMGPDHTIEMPPVETEEPKKKDSFNWWKNQPNNWRKYKTNYEQFGIVPLACIYFPEGKYILEC